MCESLVIVGGVFKGEEVTGGVLVDLAETVDLGPRDDTTLLRYANAAGLRRLLATAGQSSVEDQPMRGEGLSGPVHHQP